MMFLAMPRHELLAHQGEKIPYSFRLMYDLCEYRDANPNFLNRVVCQGAFLGLSLGLSLISLVDIIVRIPFAYIAAAFSKNHSKSLFAIRLSLWTNLFTLAAVSCNLFAQKLTNTLIQLEWKLRPSHLNRFLFQACEFYRYDLAKILAEEYGADPHDVFANPHEVNGYTAALVPHFLGDENHKDFFPLNEFEKNVIELKLLGHWLNLNQEVVSNEIKISTSASAPEIFFSSLSKALEDFNASSDFPLLKIPEEKIASLKEALKSRSAQEIVQRIQNQKLTFINGGWKGHCICLCFFGNYMAIGNRGESKGKSKTLEVYKIDPSTISVSLIEEIWKHGYLDKNVAGKFLYETLPARLSKEGKVIRDSLCENFSSISPKLASAETCSMTAKKAVLRFALALLKNSKPSLENLEEAKWGTKLFTCWAAYNFSQNTSLLSKFKEIRQPALAKAHKKLEKYRLCQAKLSGKLSELKA